MRSPSHHAIVTGGTGTLGRAIAQFLKSKGWTVDAPGRTALDVRNQAAVRRYFDNRPVDLLVCAAGITRDAPLSRLKEDAWDETWRTNFKGAADCAAATIPGMLERGRGHIIFISSYSALDPPIGQTAYATSKAALLGLVKDLAGRHGAEDLRVNAVLPGFLETRMTATVSDARRARVLSDHALKRFNRCEEVAEFLHFLHHHLPHTSGQVFQLDSRLHAR